MNAIRNNRKRLTRSWTMIKMVMLIMLYANNNNDQDLR
jgi:hypothetical protein